MANWEITNENKNEITSPIGITGIEDDKSSGEMDDLAKRF